LMEELTARVFGLICPHWSADLWPNSANLNLYANSSQSVGWHADDESLFQGKFNDIRILSLSLGVKRTFQLRINHAEEWEKAIKVLPLGNGDLMTMEGMTQKHYNHRVPKEEVVSGERINLTWRWVRKHAPRCPIGRSRPPAQAAGDKPEEVVRNPDCCPGGRPDEFAKGKGKKGGKGDSKGKGDKNGKNLPLGDSNIVDAPLGFLPLPTQSKSAPPPAPAAPEGADRVAALRAMSSGMLAGPPKATFGQGSAFASFRANTSPTAGAITKGKSSSPPEQQGGAIQASIEWGPVDGGAQPLMPVTSKASMMSSSKAAMTSPPPLPTPKSMQAPNLAAADPQSKAGAAEPQSLGSSKAAMTSPPPLPTPKSMQAPTLGSSKAGAAEPQSLGSSKAGMASPSPLPTPASMQAPDLAAGEPTSKAGPQSKASAAAKFSSPCVD